MTKATNKTIDETLIKDGVRDATNSLAAATRSAGNVFNAFTAMSKNYITGVVAVDKALFNIAKKNVSDYVEHGKQSMNARCINDLIDLQATFAHSRIENTATNARDVADLTKAKLQETYAPVKAAFSA